MGALINLIYFAGVVKGSVFLAEHMNGEAELAEVCSQQLEKVAANHSEYNFTCRGRMVSCLMLDGFSYCGVIDEALGKPAAFKFLREVADAFWKFLTWRGLPVSGEGLAPLSQDVDFGPILKRLAAPYVGVPQQESEVREEQDGQGKARGSDGAELIAGSGPLSPKSGQHALHPKFVQHALLKDPVGPSPTERACFAPVSSLHGNEIKHGKGKANRHVSPLREIVTEKREWPIAKQLGATVGSPSGSGDLSPQMNGHINLCSKDMEYRTKLWWSNVKLVLILDVFVCLILFSVWLGICKGFNCLSSKG